MERYRRHPECAGYAEADGRAGAERLIAGLPRVTAVVAGNDLIALGALSLLAERGLSCPRDVSVVGFNDMPLLDKLAPPLTTVRVPHHEMGAQAAQLLVERLRDPDGVCRTVLLPAQLIVRGSTGPATGAPHH